MGKLVIFSIAMLVYQRGIQGIVWMWMIGSNGFTRILSKVSKPFQRSQCLTWEDQILGHHFDTNKHQTTKNLKPVFYSFYIYISSFVYPLVRCIIPLAAWNCVKKQLHRHPAPRTNSERRCWESWHEQKLCSLGNLCKIVQCEAPKIAFSWWT